MIGLLTLNPAQAARLFATALLRVHGGATSGNFGHAGRPGEVGGSASFPSAETVQRALQMTLRKARDYGDTRFILPDGTRLAAGTNNPAAGNGTHEEAVRVTAAQHGINTTLGDALGKGVVRMEPSGGIEVGSPVTSRQADEILAVFAANRSADFWVDVNTGGDIHNKDFDTERVTSDGLRNYINKYFLPTTLGGVGSGDFGHAGRPGEIGGSGGGGFESMVSRLQDKDGGFTYQPVTDQEPKTGFAVAVYRNRERDFSAKNLDFDHLWQFTTKNWDLLQQADNYLGAWHNPENDRVYLDVSKVVKSASEAEQLGRDHDQLSYFDLSQRKSIPVTGSARRAAQEAYLSTHWTTYRSADTGRHRRTVSHADGSDADAGADAASEGRLRAIDLYIAGGSGSGNFGHRGRGLKIAGGKGSGDFNHRGRPGEVGGSGENTPMPGFAATPAGHPLTPALQATWKSIARDMHDRLSQHTATEYNLALEEIKTQGHADVYHADVYHGTSEEALSSIAEHGLIPKGGPGADEWAKIHWSDTFDKVAKGVLLKVSIPKEAAPHLRIDELSHSMRFEGAIPPQWISVVKTENGETTPVVSYKKPKAASEANDTIDLYFVFFAAPSTAPTTAGGSGSGNFGHAGRPGEVGGSTATGFETAPFSKGGAAKWRRHEQARYNTDPNFRAAVDATTLLTQGSTNLIRAGSLAAAGHEDELVRDYYKQALDKPLRVAANPMGSYKSYFEGQDVEHAEYMTLREAGAALNNAVDASPQIPTPIYRGMPVSLQASIGAGQTLDPVSGHVVVTDEKAYEKGIQRDREEWPTTSHYVTNPFFAQIDALKKGDAFDLPAVTSFTSDKFIADQFARGEARGQGRDRGGDRPRYHSAVTLEVNSGRGLPVAALSPWNQNEVLTRGNFRVESVTKTPYRRNINDYHIVLSPREK